MSTQPLLDVKNLEVRYRSSAGIFSKGADIFAVNDVTIHVDAGETLGIVGESGSGKSTLGQAVIGLAKVASGEVLLKGVPRQLNSDRIQIVFQDPQASLNPRLPIWRIVTEPLHIQGRFSRTDLKVKAAELAAAVGLRPEAIHRFPHEFSGGQRQRIAIARALSLEPELLVLDEPTSALDVSVQAQIINLLLDIQETRKISFMLISHDVSVVKHVADRVAVMYLGQIVETGPTAEVFGKPKHPYTVALLAAVPEFHKQLEAPSSERAGELPSNRHLPKGCFFIERCPMRGAGCDERQTMRHSSPQHYARCHRLGEMQLVSA